MKVGIITHYYKSQNYGGNLQAYALCKAIEGLGHHAEQISLDRNKDIGFLVYIRRRLAKFIRSAGRSKGPDLPDLLLREKAILSFNETIKHSKVYSERSIAECRDLYDVFISGSDQVWHPSAVCDAYLLTFAPSEKVKMSYAASVAHNVLTEIQKDRYKKAFSDFSAISVREQDTAELLQELSPVPIEWVLDPTLLISREDWLEISTPSKIDGEYIFCYFLGDGEKQRELATEYAKKIGCKVVTLPHLLGEFRECDRDFGDVKLYDVTPQRLISLINDAQCVFTDSFHATVFSLLMENQPIIFQRSGSEKMSTRIYNLLSLFDANERFCDTEEKASMEYIDSVARIEYGRAFEKYEHMKTKSYDYLKTNIEKCTPKG